MGFLRSKNEWPHGYVIGNKYFDGTDGSQRLPNEWALKALILVDEALAKGRPVNTASFSAEYCRPMLMASSWVRFMTSKFGANAMALPIARRVVRMLQSEGK